MAPGVLLRHVRGRRSRQLAWLLAVTLAVTLVPPATAQESATSGAAGSIDFLGGDTSQDEEGLSAFAAAGTVPLSTYDRVDYVTAGVGGMRGDGTGEIVLSGVTGTVEEAFLVWQGPTNSELSDANATVRFDGRQVRGFNQGFSSDNCWGFDNSQAYRADVTSMVHGDGTYTIADMVKPGGIDVNGASLLVFFDDGDFLNDRRVSVYIGNDSNIDNAYDPEGWDLALKGIVYEGGEATVELHVSDGQSFPDDAVRLDSTVLAPSGPVFDGNTVPGGSGPSGNGSLWDIREFDISSALSPLARINDVRLTTGVNSDCLSAVVAIVAVDPTTDLIGGYQFNLTELWGLPVFYGFADDPVNTASGNLSDQVIDLAFGDATFGLDLMRAYNAQDARQSVLGRGWKTAIDTAIESVDGGTVTVRMPDGRRVRFLARGDGGFTRPEGVEAELVSQSGGTYQIATFDGEVWRFDAAGRLSSRTRWDGQAVELQWEGDVLRTVVSSAGQTITFAYDGDRVVSATASDGRTVQYGYDGAGLLTSVVDPAGGQMTYAYDTAGRLTRITDASGALVVASTYDDSDRVIAQEEPGGATSTFVYDDQALSTTITYQPSGEVVIYTHDVLGRLESLTDPEGNTTSFQRQADGEVAAQTDRLGEQTTRVHNRDGLLLSETSSSGTRSYTHDGFRRLTSITEPWGGVTRYTYEGAERLPSTVIDPDGAITTYDLVDGLITRVSDPDGVITTFTYDAHRRLASSTDGTGATTTFAYDPAGRLVATTAPNGGTAEFLYDDLGRLIQQTSPTGDVTSWTHDAAGRVLTTTEPGGGVTQHTYDDHGRLTSSSDPRGDVTTFTTMPTTRSWP